MASKTSPARKSARTATPSTARRSAPRTGAAQTKPTARKAAPAPRKSAPAAAPAAAPRKAASDNKPPKAKLVRDSFTMPKLEYAVIDRLKQRGAGLAHPVKKSELLRAGIKALAAMADEQFLAAVRAVPAIKTGRPKSKKTAQSPLPA